MPLQNPTWRIALAEERISSTMLHSWRNTKSAVRNSSLHYLLESGCGSLHVCSTQCYRFVSSNMASNVQQSRASFATGSMATY
ncbi:hypothetical protein HBH98_011430 [Parastagonospora nodorum]|nr:hypothetical protein HBH46_112690 [Parastagonospora nodorum]KAH4353843.1 hypothetical protein HBH98_011430 [Parastagonospora nodorum]KAH4397462.1 hypothetical protein HBH97_003510 [Parastagonospora nodorum]KAH4429049.1 hypothetical protein HBH99_011490 [Parastagonospora nodorum]KAH4607383.1 hypothetical protein HBH82_091470 [Parastagonospora nodorum]